MFFFNNLFSLVIEIYLLVIINLIILMRKKPSKRTLIIILVLYIASISLIAWTMIDFLNSIGGIFVFVLFIVVAILAAFFLLIYLTDWSPSSFRSRKWLFLERVDSIICYNCKDIFIEKENVCDKCGAPKPNCIVCGLNLSPETDPTDTIVITPCCSVYVHKDHILEWLKVKEICPNCKQKLVREDLIFIE